MKTGIMAALSTGLHTTTRITLAPTMFYWQVLDPTPTGPLPRSITARERRLGFLFETVLPVPIEDIHAVYRPLGDGRWLACGMDRDALQDYRDASTLTPVSLPAFLECTTDPASLNLLVGEMEPAPVRAARRRTTLTACVMIVLCAGLLFVGLSRRAAAHEKRAASFAAAESAIYAEVLPPSTSTLPPAARMTAELRGLERTRGQPIDTKLRPDAPRTLAALLGSWPGQRDGEPLHVLTESLSVSPTSISILARLPDEASAEVFEQELHPPPGWRGTQPSVQRERDTITVRVRMEPEP
ncbi:MAG: hypothetical protein Q9O74_00970 [Planctomycetota bacterium]|nr:hypothetical protein [Planctomycetota bacterium]